MSSPLPLRPAIDHSTRDRTVLDLGGDSSDAVFEALGSQTARAILVAVSDEPSTASEIADRVDTSLQNAQYHLNNLKEANIVAAAGTWYSERGTEMTVYAPAMDRLEFCLNDVSDDESGAVEPVVSASTTAAVLND